MKHIKLFEEREFTDDIPNLHRKGQIYSIMDKNILNGCEYYGFEDDFFVYNKEEDWYIQFSNGLSATNRNWKRGIRTVQENLQKIRNI
jgi:hypothetical protein